MKTAKEMLEFWQDLLQLNDWKIVLLDNCSPNDMNNYAVQGENEWDEVHKSSVIRIIDKKDYGERIVPFDKEKTLVHELLHIKFGFLDNSGNSLQDRILHQIIDDMAKALVIAKRTR